MSSRTAYAVARSQSVARCAAHDSLIGAALGLLLVSGLVAGSIDIQQSLLASPTPLVSLGVIVVTVVAQCAAGASVCGALWRKFSALD